MISRAIIKRRGNNTEQSNDLKIHNPEEGKKGEKIEYIPTKLSSNKELKKTQNIGVPHRTANGRMMYLNTSISINIDSILQLKGKNGYIG